MTTTRKRNRRHIEVVEDNWRDAQRRAQVNPTSANDRKEQEWWDTLAEAKAAIEQCLMPGCRNVSRDYAYCEMHRENRNEG